VSRLCSIRTGLSSRVGHLNPAWTEESGPGAENARFLEAVTLTATELLSAVSSVCHTWLPARRVVVASLAEAATVHPSGRIIVLKQ
jgi:uncharacterized UPF0160 family protein